MIPELENAIRQLLSMSRNPVCEGWATAEKALAMAELIVETRPDIIVEIGVFGGRSLIPQAMACKVIGKGVCFGIDAWKHDVAVEGMNSEQNNKWWKNVNMNRILAGCITEVCNAKVDPRCIIIRAASQDVANLFSQIDILHIDGAHSEVASCRDVELYFPKVVNGGYVWMDDCDWATTKKANEILEKECEIIKELQCSSIVRLYRKKIF